MWEQMVKDYYKKTTIKKLVKDVVNGDVSSLRNYVSSANQNNREISAELVSKLNFRVFAEGGVDASTQDNVRSLVTELKNK